MKFTLEEFKNLKIGTWVWAWDLEKKKGSYFQVQEVYSRRPATQGKIVKCLKLLGLYYELGDTEFEQYGKTWEAYRNKESMCPHDVCVFPECENQSYCQSAIRDAHKDDLRDCRRGVAKSIVNMLNCYNLGTAGKALIHDIEMTFLAND